VPPKLIAIALLSALLGQGCAPIESYTFQVVDSETQAPVSAVEAYCMSATWQPSAFLGIPAPNYLPTTTDGYTNDSGMVRLSNVSVFQHVLFEKQGYEPVLIDRTWPEIAASTGSNQSRLAVHESKGVVVIPMARKTSVAEVKSSTHR
jgi:hypothetical protein